MVERESGASRLFNILNCVFLAFIGIICLYPFLYVVFASFSDPNQFIKHDFTVLWAPAGFSLEAYKQRWYDTVLPVDQSVGHGGYALGDIAPDGTEHL